MLTKFKVYIICLFFLLVSNIGKAQKINVSLPDYAHKNYIFVLNKGINQDTVQTGTFSFAGSATLNVPQKYKDYIGVGFLYVKDKPSINMIINHENFSITQEAGKYKFSNSPENQYLYSFLQRESTALPADTSLYAFRFINIFQYMNKLNALVNGRSGTLTERFEVHDYALNKLNMEDLYTSSLWFYIIDALTKYNNTQELFAQDMVKILSRIKSQEVFEAFSNNLVTILNQYGWDDAFDIIIPYIVETGRIKTPQGKMYTAFTLAKLRRGMAAPPLSGLNVPLNKGTSEKTLLFFYESDCPNCIEESEILKKNYPSLEAKKVRVVSVSADYSQADFDKVAKSFPWKDKICDLKGFAGDNFMNYGILGTPTYFLIDKENKIISRFAKFKDIIF